MPRTLVAPERDADLIGLEIADLQPGESYEASCDRETVAVVLGGVVEVFADGRSLGMAGGRSDVFEGPGFAVYAPPGTRLRLTATVPTQLAVATAPLGGATPAEVRIISPDDQRITEVGAANWRRTVRTILGPEHAAGRLLLGETINAPGNWSSYPPHKHDRQAPPDEVQLEEVYLFKVQPAGGFGVQIRYGGAAPGPVGAPHDASIAHEAFTVRDDDVAVIKSGYHPVVAAPGYSLYYLWIMAGQGREMIPYVDPVHRWVQGA